LMCVFRFGRVAVLEEKLALAAQQFRVMGVRAGSVFERMSGVGDAARCPRDMARQ
jgi:hypothetical protein